MKRITVTLTDPEHKKLKRIAGFHKRSLDKEAAVAVAKHLNELNPEVRK